MSFACFRDPRQSPPHRVALDLVLIAGSCVVLWQMALRVLYELAGPMIYDSLIYLAVGRGILNGLAPYRDLIETKPPGIFLLSAISQALSGDLLAHVFQAACIAAIPVITVLAVRRVCGKDAPAPAYVLLLAAIAGAIFALFTATLAGEYQVESFGALAGAIFVLAVADPSRMSMQRIIGAGCALAVAVAFKEPFLLPLIGCALVLSRAPRDLLKTLILPGLIGGALFLLLLVATGWLQPYLSGYLTEMLEGRIGSGVPLWKRGFDLASVFGNLTKDFSPSAAVLVGLLIVWHVIRRTEDPGIFRKIWGVVACLVALYLAVAAVGITGVFSNHLQVFAVPLYLALVVRLLGDVSDALDPSRVSLLHVLGPALVLCLVLGPWTSPGQYLERLEKNRAEMQIGRTLARQIDGILDGCGIDRWLYIGGHSFPNAYGFTRHSPLGPLFFQAPGIQNQFDSDVVHSFINNIGSARFILMRKFTVFEDNKMPVAGVSYLMDHFTFETPICAGKPGDPADPKTYFLYRIKDGPFEYDYPEFE